ncbi:MAG: lysine 5,6-aminomutase subunit alpha [Candidatus Limnocylindrales bacterium]
MSGGTVSGEVEAVRRRAAELAARLSPPARRSATIAQERAILRMFGVDGLDRAGHPLAASMAERYCSPDRERLARGVLLPFVVALLEYDLPARDLGLEVASGAIDLGLEAELLDRPERLAAAEAHAARLLAAALARFDANRTAARDMRDVLGQADEPWLGVALRAADVEPAAEETKSLVREGADVVQVRVPASWEFAEARRQAGLETPGLFEVDGRLGKGGRDSFGRGSVRRVADRRRGGRGRPALPQRLEDDLVPAGSQRGLAALRNAADDAAAERGCYASLMTVTSAFAAPEQAVVAAFERIDLVEADPIREIVEDNVDPERALADHAFAHRLQARAGCRVVMGPGPLALGADVASGIPSDAATRAGRALALQALGVELALADGLAADRLLLGAVPSWVAGDGDARAILVQAWLRSVVFPAHRLVVGEPQVDGQPRGRASALVTALSGAAAALVVRDRTGASVSASAADLGAAASTAAALRAALGDGALHGEAAELAMRTLHAANAALERLAGEGWGSLLGPAGRGNEAERFGGGAVVERAAGPTSSVRLLAGLA